MNPLFDLFVETADGPEFLMRSPLLVIEHFLHLRREASARVLLETRNGGVCKLHSNDGRKIVHVVQQAARPLGTTEGAWL